MNDHKTTQTTPEPVDLTNCDREPIHLLGRVQSYGVLVAVSLDWMIHHVSENAESLFGMPAREITGRPLFEFLPQGEIDRIRKKLRLIEQGSNNVRLFGVELFKDGRKFDVSVHQSGARLVIEFEQKATAVDRDELSEVYPLITRLKQYKTTEKILNEAARGLRALSGFDRVMVYQFGADGSGTVMAEARDSSATSYLGLRFPASDIPKQARALYKKSLLRLIADVNDAGSPIYPQTSPEGEPLDLSLAVTRAVSTIHLEYLRNMGVGASMSVSIIKDGELWGLFACHHNSPRYIDFELRSAVELFVQLFAYELTQHTTAIHRSISHNARALHDKMLSRMTSSGNLAESVSALSDEIGEVIRHDGIVMYSDETFTAMGTTPTEDEFRALARFLNTTASSKVYATDNLSSSYQEATDWPVAGILALPISRRPRDYVVLCRKEIVKSVNWAGNPEKPVELGPNGARLTPRKSFDLWRQIVKGQSEPWKEVELGAAEMLRASLLEVVLKIADAANEERKKAQEQQELLIAELNHRVRNILNLIRGLVNQSKSTALSVDAFTSNLDGRIHSLARAHDQLTRKEWSPSSLTELILVEAQAYLENKANRLRVTGPDVLLSPEAFTTVALVIHEMVTNSAKYGALTSENGHVEVALSRAASGHLVIDWRESGGPAVKPPSRRGFGSTIIERSIPYEMKGTAEINYRVTGLEARFTIPENYLTATASIGAPEAAARMSENKVRLSGRVLVVEDSMIIAMDAADIAETLGATEVITAANVRDGLAAAATGDFQLGILDVNLGAETSVEVAHLLASKGIPMILTTGYGDSEDIRRSYPEARIVRKPYTTEIIESTISDLFG